MEIQTLNHHVQDTKSRLVIPYEDVENLKITNYNNNTLIPKLPESVKRKVI